MNPGFGSQEDRDFGKDGFPHLTTPVGGLGRLHDSPPPLPRIDAVEDPLPVNDPVDEPLVNLETSGITCLHPYAGLGLPGSIPTTYARLQVASRLKDVEASLPDGIGLCIFDGWRSLTLQRALSRRAIALGTRDYVSVPSEDPLNPPPHVTGGAVDVTLTIDGAPVALGTHFDEFTPLAHPDAFEQQPGPVRDFRRLLYWSMRSVEFVIHELEWWHFEYGTGRWATILGRSPIYGPTQPASAQDLEARARHGGDGS